MKCPCCSGEVKTLVLETRTTPTEIARRRECVACGGLFYTREYHDPDFMLRPARQAPRNNDKPRPISAAKELLEVWGRK